MGQTRNEQIAPYGHLEKSGSQIANAPLMFPGVRGELKKNITTSDGVVLAAGTRVIIQPMNRPAQNEKFQFIITPYIKDTESARKDQPESQRDTIALKSHHLEIANPEEYLNFNDEHFRENLDVLFPNPNSPSLDEIKQARIPDCFLLAAIQAILTHPNGKAFLRGMMHQNDDGTTTVRLYNPETKQPEYIRVENSVIIDGLGELSHHTALWVHIIEKAYAAQGKRHNKTVDASVSSVYSNGGHANYALATLTGLKSETFYIKPTPLQIDKFLDSNILEIINGLLDMPEVANSQITNCLATMDLARVNAIYNFFGATIGNEESELQALNEYVALIKCRKKNSALYAAAVAEYSTQGLEPRHATAATILSNVFNRTKSFSGFYSPEQLKIVYDIQNALAVGKLVTTATPPKFAKPVTGIVPRHAYGVIGVYQKPVQVKDSNGNVKTIQVWYARVRNPWGNREGVEAFAAKFATSGIGRKYKQDTKSLDIIVTPGNKAIFSVELTHLCQNFESYYISEPAAETFRRDAEKEKCMVEIAKLVNDTPIDFTISHSKLIEANSAYQNALKKLLQVELLELKKLDSTLIANINAIFNSQYDAAIEHLAVTGLIDEKLFPTVSGQAQDVKEHIYALLKLQWLKAQNINDQNLEQKLIDKINLHAAQPDIWLALTQFKIKLNMILNVRIKSEQNDLAYMLKLEEKLQHSMVELREMLTPESKHTPESINTHINIMISDFFNLENLYHQLLNLEMVLKNFGYGHSCDSDISNLASFIRDYTAQMKTLAATRVQFTQLANEIADIRASAIDLEKKHEITPQMHKAITHATDRVFSGDMGKLAKDLKRSPKTENIAEKLKNADTLAKKISRALSKIGSFFAKISANLNTFFHLKNSYTVASVEQAKKQQPERHIIKSMRPSRVR